MKKIFVTAPLACLIAGLLTGCVQPKPMTPEQWGEYSARDTLTSGSSVVQICYRAGEAYWLAQKSTVETTRRRAAAEVAILKDYIQRNPNIKNSPNCAEQLRSGKDGAMRELAQEPQQ